MTSLFTRIIDGEIPARFVWQDDLAVAFLTIAPIRPGHTLVVPRQEIDSWTAASTELAAHLMGVAQTIGRAVEQAWDAPRSALIIAGFEVPHLHLHVYPAWGLDDLSFDNAQSDPDPAVMDDAAERIRAQL